MQSSGEWLYGEGNPVAKLHLSEAIMSNFAVDEDNKCLYGISQDAETLEDHFVRYDLSGVL